MSKPRQGEGPFLTDTDVQEFIEIYKQGFKIDLSPEDARAMASRLLELYSFLAKPLPQKTFEAIAQKVLPSWEHLPHEARPSCALSWIRVHRR